MDHDGPGAKDKGGKSKRPAKKVEKASSTEMATRLLNSLSKGRAMASPPASMEELLFPEEEEGKDDSDSESGQNVNDSDSKSGDGESHSVSQSTEGLSSGTLGAGGNPPNLVVQTRLR